jgi:hypothetical protein
LFFLNHIVASYWAAPYSSVHLLTTSTPIHHPLPNLYKGFWMPPMTFALKMATAMCVETLVKPSIFYVAYSQKLKLYITSSHKKLWTRITLYFH